MKRTHNQTTWKFSVLTALISGCGPLPSAPDGAAAPDSAAVSADAAAGDGASVVGDASPTTSVNSGASVVEFAPGPGAGFGQSRMPDVVLGVPQGTGDMLGSTHVVSLGRGGRICLRMSAPIEDGPGADFIVFENPFFVAGLDQSFIELGEVSVSDDGQRFVTFDCQRSAPYRGCAGVTPVYSNSNNGIDPTDPRYAGGDAFDLSAVSLSRATVVCIRDLETLAPMPPSSGFDLDAIVAVRSPR
ncbi:MAG: hypothetical protein U0269_26165 [Polyangiales bacterium]